MSDRLKKEIEALDKEKALFEDDIERYQTQLAERERILETYDQQAEMAKEKIATLLKDQPWIKAEEPFFGKEGTMYDFRDLELMKLTEEIDQMELTRDELKKKFDPKVEELAKKNQEMYSELERKRDTIKADKQKLQETI